LTPILSEYLKSRRRGRLVACLLGEPGWSYGLGAAIEILVEMRNDGFRFPPPTFFRIRLRNRLRSRRASWLAIFLILRLVVLILLWWSEYAQVEEE
jgi:hypothetical protein